MNFTRFYVRRRKVIIPTVGQTEAGVFVDINPVSVVDVSDRNNLIAKMAEALARENPMIPEPQEEVEPGSVILDKVGIRRWEAFEKQSAMYIVHKRESAVIVYVTGRGANGMWTNKEPEKILAPETSTEDISAYIADHLLANLELMQAERPLPMLLPPVDKPQS